MNKFFNVGDRAINNMDGFVIPYEWWSRPYEYQFAIDQLEKNDVILDAGCGIEHPFKYYASLRVKKVYAVDYDERINRIENTTTLQSKCMSMLDLDTQFEEKMFDKIFCISVLEHTKADIIPIMQQFIKILKDDGKIVLTIDYPTLTPEELIYIANELNLEFVGDVDYTKDETRTIKGQYAGLRCFGAVLRKKIEKQEIPETEYEKFEKDIKKLETEYEVKIIKPEETKEEKIIPIIPKKRGRKPKE